MDMLGSFKLWLKHDSSTLAKTCHNCIRKLMQFSFPVIPFVHAFMLKFHLFITHLFASFLRIVYWTPLFKSRLITKTNNLYLYSGMPLVLGHLTIEMGDNCRVSGISTLSGRSMNGQPSRLVIGNNVDINWQNNIAVGGSVIIEDNVRLAGRVFLAGYPGHPIDAQERAAGLPDHASQVGDIILKRDVWLATGVSVMAGVTIGEGTIVAAGSIVTTDLPSGVLAGGTPAKVIKSL
ncbi:acyltransferase [Moritella sp. 24]|uniref:acyltransferase n=1 Tax=Moritella sp. 24 TaxID=2746230 RepID=UPI001BF0F275|nr:acyltransferase [Moritella sp. 24]QUM76637.1 acyltransferase [Moritella sp. 24]